MNQDQVKAKLLSIEDPPMEFTLVFSGKKSRKVNGLYKPETREIIIHNRNFEGSGQDNLLLYTAIHEYAHHIHACSRGPTLSSRTHTQEFWAIFHGLLEKAESMGIYRNVFSLSPELTTLTEAIREKYVRKNGALLKELGAQLLKAHELCNAAGGRWEDYVDRVLRIPRQTANLAVKTFQYNLNPESGPDNMRFLASLSNEEKRNTAEAALLGGKSPDTVKTALRTPREETPRLRLEKEKLRLERTISSLTRRLQEVERELGDGATDKRAL